MANLPAALPPLKDMVDTVAHWLDVHGKVQTPEGNRALWRHYTRQMLAAGTIPTMRVIEVARSGHADADLALREWIAEKLDRNEELPTTLKAYAQEAMFRPPASYPKGENIIKYWARISASWSSSRWQ